jgi:RecB family exonuclease
MPDSRGGGALWAATGPKAWPAAPTDMSVSTLAEIETCPRRWALAAADYPNLWDRHGYPPRIFIASVTGTVVHLALETVTRALVHDGCTSVEDAHAVQVMRKLGGYTKLINDCIERVLHRFADNPRAAPMLEVALRSLQSRIPEMRIEAQSLLGHVRLHGGTASSGAQVADKDRRRTALGPGTYLELEIRASRIGWRGMADLLTLSDSNCEIVDFKTGAQTDTHRFQVQVYALLWSRDFELNPTTCPVGRLTLSYPAGEVRVNPPTPAELDALERELLDRHQAALNALSTNPPEARPSVESCRYCAVRHLCQEYWQPATVRALAAADSNGSPFMDLQLFILTRHGPSSWDGVVEVSRGIATGKQIVLRTASPETGFGSGDRIRVLDAHISTVIDDESQPVVATLNTMSEAFLVPRTKG